jgi:hypothetical protein
MTTFGSVPGIDAILGDWGNKEPSAVIAIFNTSLLQEMPAELNLKLELHVTDTALPEINQTATGPFILEFSLPSHSGKVIDVNQTVETAGVSITLEKVVISPWVTQVIFNFYPPYNNTNMAPIVSLELPVGESEKKCFMTTPSGQYFLGDFTDKHGECIVTISELVFPPNPPPGFDGKSFTGEAEDTKRLAGPWIFHFAVP